MFVKLRRAWFAPNGYLYQPAPKGVEVPDELAKKLPPDAEIIGAKPVEVPEPAPAPATLRDFDEARAFGTAQDKANDIAVKEALEAVRAKNASRPKPTK